MTVTKTPKTSTAAASPSSKAPVASKAAPRVSAPPPPKADRWTAPNPADRTAPARAAASYSLTFADGAPALTANGVPATGGIEAGKALNVNYYKRLPVPESEVDSVTLRYRIDGQDYPGVQVASLNTRGPANLVRKTGTVQIPASARGEIEYWFEVKTRSGQTVYDSNSGRNYKANVVPAGGATVKFDDLFNEAVTGQIKAGESLKLNYDMDRLRKYMGDQFARGGNTLAIDAWVQFDGGAPQQVPVARFDSSGQLQTLEAAVEVPADARNVKIWFRGKGAFSEMYDSNFGANYSYSVQR